MPFVHSYPSRAIRKKVGCLTGKGLSAWPRAGTSDFSAELEAGVGSALLPEPGELTVLLLRQSQAERRGQLCARKETQKRSDRRKYYSTGW